LGKSHPHLGYIPSEGDAQRRYYRDRVEWYARWGLTMPVYFELDRDYRPELLEELWECDAIHLSGGNTYYFLHWLQQRELLEPLRQYVARGGVLIGVSAGAILLTAEISVSSFFGDRPLDTQADLAALNLVDFSFAPHLNTLRDLKPLKEYARTLGHPLYGCRDGDGILVDGNRVEFVGEIVEF
jgi:dipeptidase E